VAGARPRGGCRDFCVGSRDGRYVLRDGLNRRRDALHGVCDGLQWLRDGRYGVRAGFHGGGDGLYAVRDGRHTAVTASTGVAGASTRAAEPTQKWRDPTQERDGLYRKRGTRPPEGDVLHTRCEATTRAGGTSMPAAPVCPGPRGPARLHRLPPREREDLHTGGAALHACGALLYEAPDGLPRAVPSSTRHWAAGTPASPRVQAT
jgi:hypothetical protein